MQMASCFPYHCPYNDVQARANKSLRSAQLFYLYLSLLTVIADIRWFTCTVYSSNYLGVRPAATNKLSLSTHTSM